MKKILLTGGFGYIGTHVALELASRGMKFDVVDCDTLSPNKELVSHLADKCWKLDLMSPQFNHYLEYNVVIHLAALISVEESTRFPVSYWKNNLQGTMNIPLHVTEHFIFASTGTAFNPTNPYAATKVACEKYIQDAANALKFGYTIFRFYNVSGLSQGVKPARPPTHLISLAAMAAKGIIPSLSVFGTDYETRDGTAIRDYIHVEDVATSIVNAVVAGPSNSPYECLGTGNGSTVLEVIDSMQRVTGNKFNVLNMPRRAGDDSSMICPSQYKHISLSKSLDDMCLSAYENI